MLPAPLSLSPPVAPMALQQLDEAEGEVCVGAVGVGVKQLTGAAQGFRPQAGLSESVYSRQQDLGQGPAKA